MAWFDCKVNATGIFEGTRIIIQLSTIRPGDNGKEFNHRWFKTIQNREKEELAIALTAITSRKIVSIGVKDGEEWEELGYLYLKE